MNGADRAQTAVAVKYLVTHPAPFVVAKGRHEVAERILQLAQKHGVAIVNQPELSDALFFLDVGAQIPEEYYQIVAEILAFIYRTERTT
jgi:flagellar biosynthesis protein